MEENKNAKGASPAIVLIEATSKRDHEIIPLSLLLSTEVLVWVNIIRYSIIIFPPIFKTTIAERSNNLFCILLEAVLKFVFLNAFLAKNIKNIATKTPNHKNFTKKNKRNALNQKSKTASEKM